MIEDFRLRVFMTVAQKGSFTLAGKCLRISQPAVSQNISELEKSLGVELFTRTRGSVSLTAAGLSFKDYAAGILHWYAAAETMFGSTSKLTGKRIVRILADTFVAGNILPDLVSKMLSVNSLLSFEILSDLSGADYDIRLWLQRHSSNPTIEDGETFLKTIPAAAVASESEYSHSAGLSRLPENVRLAVWEPYSQSLTPDIASKVAVRAASTEAVLKLVSNSPDLVGLVPLKAMTSDLVVLPFPLEFLEQEIHFKPSEEFSSSGLCQLIQSELMSGD